MYKDQLNLPIKLNNEYELYIIGVGVGGAEQNESRNSIAENNCHASCPVSVTAGAMGLTPGGRYRYTESLLELEGDQNQKAGKRCEGFLPLTEWEPVLASHPDQQFADFLRRGIQHGFRIGFNRSTSLQPMSVQQHAAIVSDYIKAEVGGGGHRKTDTVPLTGKPQARRYIAVR